MLIRENVEIANLTTMRLGGKARYVADIENKDDLVEYSDSAYRVFYKEHYHQGTDIKVMKLGNEPMRFAIGTIVHVLKVDDAANIHCTYGYKNRINLIPGVDTFQKVTR